jgi:hypothetical protein
MNKKPDPAREAPLRGAEPKDFIQITPKVLRKSTNGQSMGPNASKRIDLINA